MQIIDKITLNLAGEEVSRRSWPTRETCAAEWWSAPCKRTGYPTPLRRGRTARATYRSASGVSDIHDVEVVGSAVVVPLIPSFLASPGTAHCDVQLYQSGKMLGTGRFAVLVSPMAAAGQDLEKSPEYQSFVAAIADADRWKADTAEAISKATEATEGANTAAQAANDAAASVDAAKQAALDAAGTAATAAETANTAANGANTAKTQAEGAAQSAQTAATRANEAAEGIESTGIIAHMQSTSNPHKVTAEQVGAPTKEYVDKQLSNKAQLVDGKIAPMPTAADVGAADTEMGSCTLTLCGSDNSGVYTTSTNMGGYVRNGKVVTVEFYMSVSAVPAAAQSKLVLLNGLPYPIDMSIAAASVSCPLAYANDIQRTGSTSLLVAAASTPTAMMLRYMTDASFLNLVGANFTGPAAGRESLLGGVLTYICS